MDRYSTNLILQNRSTQHTSPAAAPKIDLGFSSQLYFSTTCKWSITKVKLNKPKYNNPEEFSVPGSLCPLEV